MNKPIVKVELFREIVAATETAIVDKASGQTLLEQLQAYDPVITGIHYLHGHPKEIIETLAQYAQGATSKFKRFPLIALFQDFPEVMGGAPGFYSDDTYHLIIARGTDQNYKAGDRYDKNFIPVLYPTYVQFMEQIRLSRKFEMISGDQYPHTKIDRLFWGREGLYGNEGNKFDDKIDCIEIQNLKLRSKTQNC